MFNFFRKFLKALNSSGKSWQLSGAIVLGLFAGFLPNGALIMFALLFLALVLNINFGLFLLFSVIFSGVGYLFDPLFESLGYMILMNEGLNGFFTTLYNSIFWRWSEFNYTLVTGALLVSSALALPLFFILNKIIHIYRAQIGEKLNEWKLTRWMKLFNEEAKSTSVFRWWGLGLYVGLVSTIVLFLVLLFDPLAKLAIEKSLSYGLQTQVSLKDFKSSFSDLSISIVGLEVADKKKLSHNMVQIDEISFDLGFSALIEKKAMIEDLKMTAMAFDVKRENLAEAYSKTSHEKSNASDDKAVEKSSETEDPFAFPNVDDILDKEELKSVKEANALKADIKVTQDKWAKISDELKSANEVDRIKDDAKNLEKSLKGAGLKQIASAAKDIKALNSKIKALKTKYSKLQKEFKADQKRLQNRISNLKDLPKEDINRLKKKYSLNAAGGSNLIGTLVNDKLGSYMKTAFKYYEMIKPYLSDDKVEVKEDIKPLRGEGRWIKYANHSNVPDLLIKKAKINIKLDTDALNIDIKDLSSNQKLYGKPMTLHANSKGSSYKEVLADVLDDRRNEKAKTDFDIKVRGLKQDEYELGSISMQDILSDTNVKGYLLDKTISANADIRVQKVKMTMASKKLVNDIMSSINTFKVDLSVKGELEKPSINVKSDLDKQLSKGLKKMASKESKKFEEKLKAGVMKKVSGSSKGLDTDLGDIGSILNNKQDMLAGINTNFSSSSNPLKGILPF